MPVTNIMKTTLKASLDLTPFGHSIWNKGRRFSVVRRPRSGSTFDLNDIILESSKKLATSFRNVGCHLPMTIKAIKNRTR